MAGKFLRGETGNPGGRPKKTKEQKEFEEKCRAMLPEVFSVLKKKLNSAKASDQEWAAQTILDRGLGKPLITQELEIETNDTITPTLAEILAQAERIRASLPGSVVSLSEDSSKQIGMDRSQ